MIRVLILLLMLLPLPALASRGGPQDGAAICEAAAVQAAHEVGVPPDILLALTLTETGKRQQGRVRPWAWSMNAAGAGSWFTTPQEAIASAERLIAAGRRNVDIGCFQLNYHWHGSNFASIPAMFEPMANARYAARFVADLYREAGDWRSAAGAFHSRRPADAARYLRRFDELRAALRSQGIDAIAEGPETYNSFAEAAGFPDGDPLPIEATSQPPERLTLLGLPLDTPGTGLPGSLAVIGGARRGLLAPGGTLIVAAAGPLIGGPAPQGAAPDAAWPPELAEDLGADLTAAPAPGL